MPAPPDGLDELGTAVFQHGELVLVEEDGAFLSRGHFEGKLVRKTPDADGESMFVYMGPGKENMPGRGDSGTTEHIV